MERNRSDRRSGRSKFQYQPRSSEEVKRRAESSGSSIDTYIRDSIKLFTPKEGDNLIRILPPTWSEAKHYGFDLYLHYGIGADRAAYLCLDKMKGESCPICEERAQAQQRGDQEYADSLKPTHRVAIWMIDRNDEKEGPLVWSMPWTIDRDIMKLSRDPRTGEVLNIDDPENGFDIEFERKGKAQRTEYIGLRIARRESELGEDEWLETAVQSPLPDVLNYYEYDQIKKAFAGGSRGRDEGRKAEKPSKSKEITHTYEDIQAMSGDDLCDLWDDLGMKGSPEQFETDEELAAAICEELGLKKSRRESKLTEASDSSASEGMSRLRRRAG